uniref:Uncharacterized protein n=1 Tax=Rhizophora mucronata TaxID=61149 RepID=A0A2P2NQI6_RHIMU
MSKTWKVYMATAKVDKLNDQILVFQPKVCPKA